MAKKRLDVLLVEKGLVESREKARQAIMAGKVRVNGVTADKPGTFVAEDAVVELLAPACPYVSRGGLKLEKALKVFAVEVKGKVVLDAGASTGGFTDCLLKHGAARVYAVDVGYGQLDWSLRQDPRVVNIERTNIRYFDPGWAPEEKPHLITADLSFISLTVVLPRFKELLRPGGEVIALVKPQFEAGRERVGKKGVVRDPAVHREVLERVINAARTEGFYVRGLTHSPITGPEGNIEYFLHLATQEPQVEVDVAAVVATAWSELKQK